jgi:TonB family protein
MVEDEVQVFDIADLDEPPLVVDRPTPIVDEATRARLGEIPGTVLTLLTIDEEGRPVDIAVEESSDPVFEQAALNAVKKWDFGIGRRNGVPVGYRYRVFIRFH